MAIIETLPKIVKRSSKRRGRGRGSGKGGHTVGRGAKGQKARGKVPLLFEGTKIKKSLLKRLPLFRGKGKFVSFRPKPIVVNLKYLNLFPAGSVVDRENLIKQGIITEEVREGGVKILGEGELKQALTVKLPVSKGAKRKIEKAGGKVVNVHE